MKLYLISQEENNDYDTYSDAVVCADNEEEAKRICPSSYYVWDEETESFIWCPIDAPHQRNPESKCSNWASHINQVKVKLIGESIEGLQKGVVLDSFHAG